MRTVEIGEDSPTDKFMTLPSRIFMTLPSRDLSNPDKKHVLSRFFRVEHGEARLSV